MKALKEAVTALERGDKKAEKAQEDVSKNLVSREKKTAEIVLINCGFHWPLTFDLGFYFRFLSKICYMVHPIRSHKLTMWSRSCHKNCTTVIYCYFWFRLVSQSNAICINNNNQLNSRAGAITWWWACVIVMAHHLSTVHFNSDSIHRHRCIALHYKQTKNQRSKYVIELAFCFILQNLNRIDFEGKKDVAQVFNNVLRRQIGTRSPTVEYICTKPEILFTLIAG